MDNLNFLNTFLPFSPETYITLYNNCPAIFIPHPSPTSVKFNTNLSHTHLSSTTAFVCSSTVQPNYHEASQPSPITVMSTNAVLRPIQGVPSLLVLAAWIENTHDRDRTAVTWVAHCPSGHKISDERTNRFPANTSEAIVQARPLGSRYDMHEVQAIVLALERSDSIACEKLDSRSLTILCSIFIYSEECLSQQRGLCLLAVSCRQPIVQWSLTACRKLCTGVSATWHSIQPSSGKRRLPWEKLP